jgi:hypothetical protein
MFFWRQALVPLCLYKHYSVKRDLYSKITHVESMYWCVLFFGVCIVKVRGNI